MYRSSTPTRLAVTAITSNVTAKALDGHEGFPIHETTLTSVSTQRNYSTTQASQINTMSSALT